MPHPEGLLACRSAELDALESAKGPSARAGLSAAELRQFIAVMSRYTNTVCNANEAIDARLADELLDGSALMRNAQTLYPDLTRGPISLDRQQWTGTGEPGGSGGRPDAARFVPPSGVGGHGGSGKPLTGGFYTSTASTVGHSMWRMYLEPYYGPPPPMGVDLFPLPWRTWDLRIEGPELSIAEVNSAANWVALVDQYPHEAGDAVFVDWEQASRSLDGVHVTLGAIAAAQGLRLKCSLGQTAPAYWDVETTLWLRWRFAGAQEVECVT